MIYWTGVREFNARLLGIAAAVDKAAFTALVEVASVLETKAKENASGRPGPNVVSGSLRRGIHQTPVHRIGAWWATEVWPSMIYSRRVELGYRGTDALGRSYKQPGYPFFTPAYEEVTSTHMGAIFIKHFSAALKI